jgi:hypothetical protein
MSTDVVTLCPDSLALYADDPTSCVMCPNPAQLTILHRCGVIGGAACIPCWNLHVAMSYQMVEWNPEDKTPKVFCRHCCDPDDDTDGVGLDHVFAVPFTPFTRFIGVLR